MHLDLGQLFLASLVFGAEQVIVSSAALEWIVGWRMESDKRMWSEKVKGLGVVRMGSEEAKWLEVVTYRNSLSKAPLYSFFSSMPFEDLAGIVLLITTP